jgi:hypothetical protein
MTWCFQEEGTLLQALLEGQLMAISDGSYKDTFGTAAWTIGDQDHPSLISNKVISPGEAEDNNSYRRKLNKVSDTSIYRRVSLKLAVMVNQP